MQQEQQVVQRLDAADVLPKPREISCHRRQLRRRQKKGGKRANDNLGRSRTWRSRDPWQAPSCQPLMLVPHTCFTIYFSLLLSSYLLIMLRPRFAKKVLLLFPHLRAAGTVVHNFKKEIDFWQHFLLTFRTQCLNHTWYLSFFLHEQKFLRIKFTPKNVNFSR